eukprot:1157054-Pelagomonas_calceolata.AAC.2
MMRASGFVLKRCRVQRCFTSLGCQAPSHAAAQRWDPLSAVRTLFQEVLAQIRSSWHPARQQQQQQQQRSNLPDSKLCWLTCAAGGSLVISLPLF